MAACYPLFDDELQQGPPGIPGIGFKLTNDGNYDMEDKILRNAEEPSADGDVTTKSYVDRVLKSSIQTLSDKSLILSEDDEYDAKGKIISNLLNPVQQSDSATKNYVDTVISQLESISLVHTPRGAFNAKGKAITNVKDPEAEKNVVNKRYFENNALILKGESYDAKNKTISNVKEPEKDLDCVNKCYVDTKTFCATTAEIVEFTGVGYKTFQFNEFSSKLLDSNLKLSQNMFMKIVIFLACDTVDERPKIRLEKGKEVLLDRDISVNEESITIFRYGKLNDILILSVLPSGNCKFKPYLHIEKIEFALKTGVPSNIFSL